MLVQLVRCSTSADASLRTLFQASSSYCKLGIPAKGTAEHYATVLKSTADKSPTLRHAITFPPQHSYEGTFCARNVLYFCARAEHQRLCRRHSLSCSSFLKAN